MQIKIHESWKNALSKEFEKPYFAEIKQALVKDNQAGKTIYPPGKLIFNAYDTTPLSQVKVVIIGQDPYHGFGQAHGLCFSVQKGVKVPPSLQNIYKELLQDIDGFQIPSHGYLQKWAEQGVLMLNAMLTVRAKEPASHRKIGWENFTDATIKTVSDQTEHTVFLLWGRFAQNKAALIDSNKHLVLKAAHPSPFSAHNGFFGCKHFSKTNAYLHQNGITPIDWQV